MGRCENTVLLNGTNHLYLLAVQKFIPQAKGQRLEVLVIIQVAVGLRIGGTVQHEFQQRGHNRLTAL